MDKIIRQKLVFLLQHLDFYIEHLVDNVLHDSVDEPEYSAVTTINLIKCYIDVMSAINEDLEFCDDKDYLLGKCFTPNEIDLLYSKVDMEAEYYIGEQY